LHTGRSSLHLSYRWYCQYLATQMAYTSQHFRLQCSTYLPLTASQAMVVRKVSRDIATSKYREMLWRLRTTLSSTAAPFEPSCCTPSMLRDLIS